MQDVHITCRSEALQSFVQGLEEQFVMQPEEAAVLDYGYTQKQGRGYVLIEWSNEAEEGFLEQLQADGEVLDYSVYTVPSVDDYPFGAELMVPEEQEPPAWGTE